jgi:chromosome segregation ATPase
LLQALDEANQENEQLARQLDMAEQSSQHECQELEQDIARHNRLQSAAREQATALKKQANDLKDEIATVQWALEEAEAEIRQWQAQVVSSPQRKQSELQRKSDILLLEKENCSNLEHQLSQCQTKVLNVQQAAKDVQSTLLVVQELDEQVRKYQNLRSQLEATLLSIESKQKQIADLEEESAQADRQLTRTDDALIHQRKQQTIQLLALQEALEAAKAQLLHVEEERRQGVARVQAGEAEVQELQRAMEREHQRTHQELQSLIQEYKQVELIYLQRNEQRLAALGIQ